MRLAVLRETRMTAVVCSLGPVQRVVDAAPAISDAVVEALAAWAAAPVPLPVAPTPTVSYALSRADARYPQSCPLAVCNRGDEVKRVEDDVRVETCSALSPAISR